MKKFISVILVLMLSVIPAFAETVRSFSVNTDGGALLIDENGNMLTAEGEYDMIEPVSSADCPADRVMYMVSQLDLSSGFFLEEDEEVEGEEDISGSFMDDEWSDELDGEWDAELDEVEEWPVDLEGLEDGFEMETIDDVAFETDDEIGEFGDVLEDDFGMDDEFMDYGEVYGVALMNSRGELLTGFDYESFWHDARNGIVLAYNFEGFITVLDEMGNVLLEGMYTSVVSDGNGGFFAIMPEIDPVSGDFSDAAPIVHITADGAINPTGLYTFSYETLPGFFDGLMCLVVCEADADVEAVYKYVFIDQNGQPQFGRYFEYASDFIDGVAEINDENYEVHLINTNGDYITDNIYSYFECGTPGDGMPIIANVAEGGFDIISKADYSIIASFRPEEGKEDLSGYLTNDGFIMAFDYVEDMLLDASGNVIWRGVSGENFVQTGYEDFDSMPQRFVVFNYANDEYMGNVVDMDLNVISDPYREIYPLSWLNGEGRYQVTSYEVIRQEYYGEAIIEPDFDTMKFGVLDQDGNVIVPVDFDYFMYLDHDRYWIGRGTDYALIDSDGNIIAKFLDD